MRSETDPQSCASRRFTGADLPNDGGYWSYVGTDVGLIPADRPTLNP